MTEDLTTAGGDKGAVSSPDRDPKPGKASHSGAAPPAGPWLHRPATWQGDGGWHVVTEWDLIAPYIGHPDWTVLRAVDVGPANPEGRARRWTIANVEEFSRAVLSGPDTRPPEGSGLVGMEWVNAARVEVVEARHVDEAVSRLRAWASYCGTMLECSQGHPGKLELWQQRYDDAVDLIIMLAREP